MTRPILVGLTGSIGMGKSTTAKMFSEEGIPVWDADAAVARMYSRGGSAVEAVKKLNPQLVKDGSVDRTQVKAWIETDKTALSKIEQVVHPLVAADRSDFIDASSHNILVFDIPLLFELGNQKDFDVVVVVTAPADLQKERVLARPGMTTGRFESLLARQMPDTEKRARADYVIETNTMDGARSAVQNVLKDIRETRVARDRS